MKIFYYEQSYLKSANASVKPQKDFEEVLKRFNAKNIGLKGRLIPNKRICRFLNIISSFKALISLPKNSIVFFQYPQYYPQFGLRFLFNKAKSRRNKIVMLIHDLNEIRHIDTKPSELIPNADLLIVHTEAMKQWIISNYGELNCLVLGIFDHLGNGVPNVDISTSMNNIVFAGNLSKSKFLELLDFDPSSIKLVLYGNGVSDSMKSKPFVDYKGSCAPHELIEKITSCGFGLVWDGDSVDECSGDYGNYLRYNSPYKLSAYLSAGLPVIVWDKMAMSEFVKSNHIGVAISSLSVLPQIIKNLTPADYDIMRHNAINTGNLLNAGYYYQNVIQQSINALS